MASMLEQLETFTDTFLEVHPAVKKLTASLQRIDEVPFDQFSDEFRDVLLFIEVNRELFEGVLEMVEKHKTCLKAAG